MNSDTLNSLIIDNLIDGIILIDETGIIQRLNKSAADMFGYCMAELVGQNISMLMPLPHNKAHDSYLQNYLKTGHAKIIGIGRTVEAVRKDGSMFPMELAITEARIDEQHYFVGFIRDITQQVESDALMRMNGKIMRAINNALGRYINADMPRKEIFDSMLEDLLDITDSQYGFIGEIHNKEHSAPYLKTQAITDISWNYETRKFYRENIRNGLEFFNLNTLFGATIRTGEYVISNEPGADPRRGGLPPGHPPLNAYLGLPIYSGNMLIGMAGLSNRPGGYNEEIVFQLRPLLGTIGSLIAGYRNLDSRRRAEQELYRAQETLRNIATTDSLTGLSNRASLYLQLEALFNNSAGKENALSILFVDIDHFKQVNDTYGHQAGDEVLQAVAAILKGSVRPNDVIGRYGGEEIVIALPDCSLESARQLAERMRKSVENAVFTATEDSEKHFKVTISTGISTITKEIESVSRLIDQADKAVYSAKEKGRNCTVVFE